MLTTAARSLASCPSGSSGWLAEQRVGDDQAQDGVAEELQALVGRQAAVLVGVRAMGQRALEQLGVDVDAERLEERRRRAEPIGAATAIGCRTWSDVL